MYACASDHSDECTRSVLQLTLHQSHPSLFSCGHKDGKYEQLWAEEKIKRIENRTTSEKKIGFAHTIRSICPPLKERIYFFPLSCRKKQSWFSPEHFMLRCRTPGRSSEAPITSAQRCRLLSQQMCDLCTILNYPPFTY